MRESVSGFFLGVFGDLYHKNLADLSTLPLRS